MKKRLIDAKANNKTTGCVLQEVPFEAEFEKIIAHDDYRAGDFARTERCGCQFRKKGLKPLVLEKSNLSTASKVSNAGAAASQSRLKASSSFNMSPTSEALPESTTDFPSQDSFSPSEELADTSLESSFQEQTESKENSKPNLNSRKRPTGTTILGKHLVAEKERRDEDREIRRQEMEQRKEERKDEKKRRLDEIERQQAVKQQQHAEKMEVERSKVKFIEQYLEFLCQRK